MHTTTVSLTEKDREQLRSARTRAGLSQLAVAEAAGCSREMVVQIESGAKSPGFGLLLGICAAVGLDARLKLVRKK